MMRAASAARLRAASVPPYTGLSTPADAQTIRYCRMAFPHGPELSATVLFTRDEGMHACGWWKNPDYERCEHLSLAFFYPPHIARPHDHERARLWCLAFFGPERVRLLWIEPPFSPLGKERDVYHYRLFLRPDWRSPVLPRGEVYSKQFTEVGWKSWSDLHDDDEEARRMETPP